LISLLILRIFAIPFLFFSEIARSSSFPNSQPLIHVYATQRVFLKTRAFIKTKLVG